MGEIMAFKLKKVKETSKFGPVLIRHYKAQLDNGKKYTVIVEADNVEPGNPEYIQFTVTIEYRQLDPYYEVCFGKDGTPTHEVIKFPSAIISIEEAHVYADALKFFLEFRDYLLQH